MAYNDRRNRSQQVFLPSSQVVLDIPQGFSILRGKVIITGTVTIAGGTTSGALIGDGGPTNLIKRIRVVGNPAPGSAYPAGWLVDATPRALLRWQQMLGDWGVYMAEQSGSVLGSGAAGTYPIYFAIPINFADPTLRNNYQTALYADASAYRSLQLQVLTGGSTDCFQGTDRTWTYNLQVQWEDNRLDITPSNPATALIQESHLIQIGAANTRLNDPSLPKTGGFLTWLLLCEQGQPGYTLSDAILSRVTVQGRNWFFDEYAQDIRQEMYDNGWLNPSSNGAGLYLIDQAEGMIQNSNDAGGLEPMISVLNPSGSYLDQINMFTRRVYTVSQGS